MKANVTAEFEMIERTEFWAKYQAILLKHIEILKNDTLSKANTNLAYSQGEYAGLRRVLLTPNEIIRSENAKSAAKQDNLGKGPSTAD